MDHGIEGHGVSRRGVKASTAWYQVIEYKWFLMSGWSGINIIMVIQKQNLEKALLKVS